MNRININVSIGRESVFESIDKAHSYLELKKVESEVSYYVRLAMEELLLNLIDHTDLGDKDLASVEILVNKEIVKLTIRDSSPPFNPLELKAPELDADIEEREIGGLGIYLLLNTTEAIHYEYLRRQNVVSLAWRRP